MPARTSERVEWVDIVKGVAIVLVVLHHSTTMALQNSLADPAWVEVNSALRAFRMPLFFFASGLFAGSVIQRSWVLLWRSRIALLVWMFVLWSVLRFTYFSVVPMPERPWESDLATLLLSPVRPMSGVWFLYALVVFLVVAKLAARVPVWVQLAVTAVVSALFFSVFYAGSTGFTGMARYAVFFLLGLHLKNLVLEWMQPARPALALAAAAAFLSTTVAVTAFDLGALPGLMTALGLLAVGAGILLGRLVADTPLARPFAYLGRNTLPIYVTHSILLAVGIGLLERIGLRVDGALAAMLPLLLAGGAASAALLIARAVRGTPLRVLYETPSVPRRAAEEARRMAEEVH